MKRIISILVCAVFLSLTVIYPYTVRAESTSLITESVVSAAQTAETQVGPEPSVPAETQIGPEPSLPAETQVNGDPVQSSDVLSDQGSNLTNWQKIGLYPNWQYADFSEIHTGTAVFYRAAANRKNKVVAVNAGHGTKGGESKKTYSHPDKTKKITGGTTAKGAIKSISVSSGMNFNDGTAEASVTLRMAKILRDKLLKQGYDVLMIRDGTDVQLDNIARTVIANNNADIHIALHWDSDGLSYDKGVFYSSVPDGLKKMEPVATHWQDHELLGDSLIRGLEETIAGIKTYDCSGHGQLDMDLTQTSYSTIPSVDVELGNQCSAHDEGTLGRQADGLVRGINMFFAAKAEQAAAAAKAAETETVATTATEAAAD